MFALLRWFAVLLIGVSFAANAQVFAAEHGAHASSGEHAEAGPKMVPGMTPSRDLALWSLVTFVLMTLVLGKFVWPPLVGGLNERERRIRQDIADAEANRVKSETLIAEREQKLATVYEEIRELLAEARRDAERTKLDIVTAAQKEAEATRHRAVADIERARDQALAELFDFVSTNVVNATERVIGRSLDQGDHERLVTQALSEMNVRRN